MKEQQDLARHRNLSREESWEFNVPGPTRSYGAKAVWEVEGDLRWGPETDREEMEKEAEQATRKEKHQSGDTEHKRRTGQSRRKGTK